MGLHIWIYFHMWLKSLDIIGSFITISCLPLHPKKYPYLCWYKSYVFILQFCSFFLDCVIFWQLLRKCVHVHAYTHKHTHTHTLLFLTVTSALFYYTSTAKHLVYRLSSLSYIALLNISGIELHLTYIFSYVSKHCILFHLQWKENERRMQFYKSNSLLENWYLMLTAFFHWAVFV